MQSAEGAPSEPTIIASAPPMVEELQTENSTKVEPPMQKYDIAVFKDEIDAANETQSSPVPLGQVPEQKEQVPVEQTVPQDDVSPWSATMQSAEGAPSETTIIASAPPMVEV